MLLKADTNEHKAFFCVCGVFMWGGVFFAAANFTVV
jgi:hypothetical protein